MGILSLQSLFSGNFTEAALCLLAFVNSADLRHRFKNRERVEHR